MNKGAGPTKLRIAPEPMNRPVPMAPPSALESTLARSFSPNNLLDVSGSRFYSDAACNIQELDVATFQTALRLASFASNGTLAIDGLAFFSSKAFGVVHGFFCDWICHLGFVSVRR